jgi:hypothetical protein
MFSPRDADTTFKCTCGKSILGKNALRHAMVCRQISMIGRHDYVEKAMLRVMREISSYVAGTELAISVYKEPFLCDLVYNGLNGSTTYWPRTDPNNNEGMENRGDIHVTFNSSRNGVHRALLMDFVITAPRLNGEIVGAAAKRATGVKYNKYRKVFWKYINKDFLQTISSSLKIPSQIINRKY